MSNELINYAENAERFIENSNTALSLKEREQFISLSQTYSLNPFKNDIYLITYNTKDKKTGLVSPTVQIVVSYLKILSIGQSQPNYGGFKIEYFNGATPVVVPLKNMENLYARATIYQIINGQRVEFTQTIINYQEYKNKNGGMSEYSKSFKNEYFTSWCEKIALVNAFRRSYSQYLQGLYIKEEFNDDGELETPQKEIQNTAKIEPKINKELLQHANDLLKSLDTLAAQKKVYLEYLETTKTTSKEWKLGQINLEVLTQKVSEYLQNKEKELIKNE